MKRLNQKNFWSDTLFVDEIREIKRAKSYKEKKDYSDVDITRMIAKSPMFQDLKKQIIEDSQHISAQIKIHMDKRRIY